MPAARTWMSTELCPQRDGAALELVVRTPSGAFLSYTAVLITLEFDIASHTGQTHGKSLCTVYTLTSPVRSRAITKSPSMLQPHVLYVKTLFCQAAALTRGSICGIVRRLPQILRLTVHHGEPRQQ